MNILGLAHDVWLSSAAIIFDSKIIAAVCEERLNRQKLFAGFPSKAIEYCLSEGKIAFDALDVIAVGWNPARHLVRANRRRAITAWKADYLVTIPNMLQQFSSDHDIYRVEQCLITPSGKQNILYIDHHMAHLANGFYLSPFREAALITMDGVGETDTATMAIGDKKGIHILKRLKYPHSLGLFYGTFTSFLGFKIDSDEWKVMALAAFGRHRSKNPYYSKMRNIIRFEKEGFFVLDLTYFNYYLQDEVGFSNDKLVSVFGPPRLPDKKILQRHYDIAAAVQWVFEDCMVHCLKTLYDLSGGCKVVALAGGSLMNSVFNGKLERVTPFKRSFISSCPDDSGISIGAALAARTIINSDRCQPIDCDDNYWGPEYSLDEIEATLRKYNIPYKIFNNIEQQTARLLADGKLIGWFQGRMEFGQRALGNRSILADPRQEKVKDKVNKAVKYRETFRPFAPAVLEEEAHYYFDTSLSKKVSFMERVLTVRSEFKNVIPAVIHVDGSARLQTVSKHTNPIFYRLIKEFGKLTGIPVVLNTSFNLNGEPIVCSPTDAIRTFYSCGLDFLVIGNCLISKESDSFLQA